MSQRAELSGAVHAGVGAGHAVLFEQLIPAVHWQAKCSSAVRCDEK